jgi:Mrp family chromosome partitioning ATPase
MNASVVSSETQLCFYMSLERGVKRLVSMPRDYMDPSLMILRKGFSSSASDYHIAAANLLRGPARTTSRIFVTSPGHGDGKTCTAFNLASALAESGKSVLLIELNFSKPRFCTLLGNLQLRYGLDSVLRGSAVPEDAVFSVASLRLHIVAVRDATPFDKLERLLEHLGAFLDWAVRITTCWSSTARL